jgi:ribonuclease HI
MEYEDIFNDYTLNIFTDASILQLPGEHIGCPGVILAMTKYGKQYEIPYDYKILRNSTNNESEITAILMGVYAGLKLRNEFRTINLFSDSRICIQGLKYWIFNWVNNIRDNKIISSSHKEVANQQIILQIIYTIIENNLRINLYHQKGHVTLDSDSQENAKKVFKETNFITEDVDRK